ncbi:MAG: hypothetical protein ACMUEL_05095 [Flavobacteriales bacterium Tduv]
MDKPLISKLGYKPKKSICRQRLPNPANVSYPHSRGSNTAYRRKPIGTVP